MSKKKLQNLDEVNGEAWINTASFISVPEKNGIACPECGEELCDTNPMIIYTTIPAMKDIHCDKCGYTGTRYV